MIGVLRLQPDRFLAHAQRVLEAIGLRTDGVIGGLSRVIRWLPLSG